MKAKIVIVGGGVMGTSIAMHAAQKTDPLSEPVVLFERRSIGAGSSGRSGAILRQHYSDREVAAMARDSLREYAAFEARAGRSVGFRRTGVLTLAGPDQAEWRKRIETNVAMLQEIGIETDLVSEVEMRKLVPGAQFQAGSVGAWEPGGGFVDPSAALESFTSLARAYGAVTRLGVEVTRLILDGGRVRGVETTEGTCSADKVVVVAGPWSRQVLKLAGIELPLRILRPENHFLALKGSEVQESEEEETGAVGFDISEDPFEKTTTGEPAALDHTGLHPAIVDIENGFYCCCEPSTKRVRVGRTDYAGDEQLEQPEPFEEKVSESTKSWAREVLCRRLPDYDGQSDAGSLAGWYTLTPDSQPILGPIPSIEGLFVATGFSGHGFKLAPSVGDGLSQMLFEETVSAFDEEFFSPERFAGKVSWDQKIGFGL